MGPIDRVAVPRAGSNIRNNSRYTQEIVLRQQLTDVCLDRHRVAGTFPGTSGFK